MSLIIHGAADFPALDVQDVHAHERGGGGDPERLVPACREQESGATFRADQVKQPKTRDGVGSRSACIQLDAHCMADMQRTEGARARRILDPTVFATSRNAADPVLIAPLALGDSFKEHNTAAKEVGASASPVRLPVAMHNHHVRPQCRERCRQLAHNLAYTLRHSRLVAPRHRRVQLRMYAAIQNDAQVCANIEPPLHQLSVRTTTQCSGHPVRT